MPGVSQQMACPDKPAGFTSYLEADGACQALVFMNELRKQAESRSGSNSKEEESNSLCDVKLLINGRTVRAHKLVLAASSEYFASVFTAQRSDTRNDVLPISQSNETDRINDGVFDALIEYAYTRRVEISEKNVHNLFYAADCLRVNGVKKACFKFLQRMLDVDNCIRMWLFAKGHGNTSLARDSLHMIEENISELYLTTAFLNLSVADVVDVLSNDELWVENEEEVYKIVMTWASHREQERHHSIGDAMQAVRFKLLTHDFLMSILENEPLIQNDLKCIPMLIAAIEYKVDAHGQEAPTMAAIDAVGMIKPRRPCLDVEEITISRPSGSRLGVGLMGGADRPGHVFYRGSRPGVRVTSILSNGAAVESNLRVGDRLLSINGRGADYLQHDQAVALIAKPSERITLLVRHEEPPPGLAELTLSTNRGLGFGLCIEGGINASPGNPMDPDDEGVFVSQILAGGAADQSGKIKVGQRILQVNTISMLGGTHAEALQAMRQSVDRLHLMVCSGFDPANLPANGDSVEERRKLVVAQRRTSSDNSITDYTGCVTY